MKKFSLYLGLVLLFALGLNSCGYKPSSKYVRNVTGEKVSTNVTVSLTDPENTVLIKDALDSALISTFHTSLVDRKYSDTHLDIRMSSPIYTPIQYNNDGYVIAYRARVRLSITRITLEIQKKYMAYGTYDFSVEPNAIITDQERFDAIKQSASKAINSYLGQLSAEGSLLK